MCGDSNHSDLCEKHVKLLNFQFAIQCQKYQDVSKDKLITATMIKILISQANIKTLAFNFLSKFYTSFRSAILTAPNDSSQY